MKLLLHTCCGPCSIYPVDVLKGEADVTGYFFNPNIHPYTEWRARRETLASYARSIELPVMFDDDYLLEEFIRGVVNRESDRCSFCYAMRLGRTAEVAAREGFDSFSSTLLVSPYQKHDQIREIGEAVAAETGVSFHYRDFRPGYRGAVERSRELEMYRQKYCGCIYSEKERYCRKKNRGS
ncbi:MAG: epoxyqueuosine reductase QueH [Firmicutes bacterium]|nr:epoxyqueuosine reductase QueH [Bacillota bacterium]MCL5058949.1 epoxyqueuosine reductase QueH [Actinomycetota bacterium]